MGILIGADFVPTRSNENLFINNDIEKLLGRELLKKIQSSEYRIFNLEIPLTDENVPIKKRGMNLSAKKECISTYSSLGLDLAVLANNHILDYGEKGLADTMDLLKKTGIASVGAGENKCQAAKPHFFCYVNRKIAVYACVQHEYSQATENTAGANCFDVFQSFEEIHDIKSKADYLIVLYHGGRECYRYPTPYLQKLCRKMIREGADLVICQHSHCIGCEEKYLNGRIIYGQGNFLFDGQDNQFWNTALLIDLQSDFSINYIPIVKKNNAVRMANSEESQMIINDYIKRSEEIKDENFVESEFEKLANREFENTIYCLTGQESILFKFFNKLFMGKLRGFVYKLKYNKNYLLLLDNTLNCEPHIEVLRKGIELYKKK